MLPKPVSANHSTHWLVCEILYKVILQGHSFHDTRMDSLQKSELLNMIKKTQGKAALAHYKDWRTVNYRRLHYNVISIYKSMTDCMP